MTLGQHALFADGVQLFVVAFWSPELVAPVRLDRENALIQGAAVLMVWWLATALRRHVLASIATARVELEQAVHQARSARDLRGERRIVEVQVLRKVVTPVGR